jgi:hypothetical protein
MEFGPSSAQEKREKSTIDPDIHAQ